MGLLDILGDVADGLGVDTNTIAQDQAKEKAGEYIDNSVGNVKGALNQIASETTDPNVIAAADSAGFAVDSMEPILRSGINTAIESRDRETLQKYDKLLGDFEKFSENPSVENIASITAKTAELATIEAQQALKDPQKARDAAMQAVEGLQSIIPSNPLDLLKENKSLPQKSSGNDTLPDF